MNYSKDPPHRPRRKHGEDCGKKRNPKPASVILVSVGGHEFLQGKDVLVTRNFPWTSCGTYHFSHLGTARNRAPQRSVRDKQTLWRVCENSLRAIGLVSEPRVLGAHEDSAMRFLWGPSRNSQTLKVIANAWDTPHGGANLTDRIWGLKVKCQPNSTVVAFQVVCVRAVGGHWGTGALGHGSSASH